MKNKIMEMFKLQNELNDFINGDKWRENITKNGQEINWIRCLKFETMEALDQSFQWKHWKNNKVNKQYDIIDLHNLKIEFVDAYHFLMSEFLRFKKNNILNTDLKHLKIVKNKNNKELFEKIENFISIILKYEHSYISIIKLYQEFWQITLSIMTLDEFYDLYISKNVLNLFRLKHGYQDGTYIKNWGKEKIEDNVFLERYLSQHKKIDYNDIYNYLEKEYKRLNG